MLPHTSAHSYRHFVIFLCSSSHRSLSLSMYLSTHRSSISSCTSPPVTITVFTHQSTSMCTHRATSPALCSLSRLWSLASSPTCSPSMSVLCWQVSHSAGCIGIDDRNNAHDHKIACVCFLPFAFLMRKATLHSYMALHGADPNLCWQAHACIIPALMHIPTLMLGKHFIYPP